MPYLAKQSILWASLSRCEYIDCKAFYISLSDDPEIKFDTVRTKVVLMKKEPAELGLISMIYYVQICNPFVDKFQIIIYILSYL